MQADELARLKVQVARYRDDLELFGSRCLKIRPKTGGALVPLVFNRAQRFIHEKLEAQRRETGMVRADILKGRQLGSCLGAGTRVLMADLTWRAIERIAPGDEIVACDEFPRARAVGRCLTRKMRTARVEATAALVKPAYRLTFDDGRSIVTTDDHRWLVRKSQPEGRWRTLSGTCADGRDAIRVGDVLRWIAKPWGEAGYEDGWFGGLLDGEGCISSPKETGASVQFSQVEGAVLDRGLRYLKDRDYHFSFKPDTAILRASKFGRRAVHAVEVSRADELFRLMGQCRPVRLWRCWWEGRALPGKRSGVGWARLVGIEMLGPQQVFDLQTSEKTFIAEGFVSHNSTYIGARFYHKVSFKRGVKAFILTHKQDATDNLFDIVDRFHENNNPLLRPTTGASNAKELSFSAIHSGYRVGTAGSAEVGRSDTIQYFHASEVSFWTDPEGHEAGVMQTVPLASGTEIIRESTGNGLMNYFAHKCAESRSGKSIYQFIFVPWFWGEDYTMPPPADFELTIEEADYAQAYGLDLGQMCWRRKAMDGFTDKWRFAQEYPATPEEALQSSGEGNYIKPIAVARARRAEIVPQNFVPIVVGIDPARGGRDATAVIDRQGRRAGRLICEEWRDGDAMALAGRIIRLIPQIKPKKIVIDATEGTGAAIYDRLCELGFGALIEPVKFSSRAFDEALYLNRRAEMWAAMKEWLDNPVGVQVPDKDDLQGQICAPIWGPGATRHNSNGQLQIELKEHVVKRLGRSPDMADALAMTFAVPIIAQRVSDPVVTPVIADTAAGY